MVHRAGPIFHKLQIRDSSTHFFLARNPEGAVSMKIARECGLSPVFLAAILKCLAKSHILASAKGVHGGSFLRPDPVDIRGGDIVRAVDGEGCSSECAMGYPQCPIQADAPCAMHYKWQKMKIYIERPGAEQLNGKRPQLGRMIAKERASVMMSSPGFVHVLPALQIVNFDVAIATGDHCLCYR